MKPPRSPFPRKRASLRGPAFFQAALVSHPSAYFFCQEFSAAFLVLPLCNTYNYDAASGLRKDRTEYDAGDNLLGRADYVFDANGRMIKMNNYFAGGTLSDYYVFIWEEGKTVDDLMKYYYSMIPFR